MLTIPRQEPSTNEILDEPHLNQQATLLPHHFIAKIAADKAVEEYYKGVLALAITAPCALDTTAAISDDIRHDIHPGVLMIGPMMLGAVILYSMISTLYEKRNESPCQIAVQSLYRLGPLILLMNFLYFSYEYFSDVEDHSSESYGMSIFMSVLYGLITSGCICYAHAAISSANNRIAAVGGFRVAYNALTGKLNDANDQNLVNVQNIPPAVFL